MAKQKINAAGEQTIVWNSLLLLLAVTITITITITITVLDYSLLEGILCIMSNDLRLFYI